MKQVIKYISDFVFGITIVLLFIYIIGMQFFPERLKSLVGYQTYVVLTNSMEPTIPVGSLVVSKNITKGQNIPEDTIISFYVNRFGNDAVFTHYFKKKEIDNTGRERYYTQAENADRYDGYETYEEDILGTYVFHIPYIGRFILFLQSPFALLELGIILVIMVVYHILANKFDEEEKAKLALQEEDSGQDFQIKKDSLMIEMETAESEGIGSKLIEESLKVSETAEIVTEHDTIPEEKEQKHSGPSTLVPDTDSEPVPVKEDSMDDAVPDNVPAAQCEELPAAQESEKPAKNIFSYRMNRPDSSGKRSAAGFSIEIFRDGTIWHKIYTADGQEQEVLTYSIQKKAVKKVRNLIKDSASDIKKLPKELDNNATEGNFGTFGFMGKEVAGRNIQAHDLKKEKKQNIYYYRKYKQYMKQENEVMYLFKQIAKILKEEGIKLKLTEVNVKKEGKK